MKKFLLPLLVLATMGAHAGGERGNGGETVDVNGIPRLRDLVENTTCDWKDGEEMIVRNPMVTQILSKLSSLDWYFAEELRLEIKDLNYCLTSGLRRIDTRDIDSMVTSYTYTSHQAAIRLNRSVYIDSDATAAMPEYDKAMLLIHESMHTYFPRNTFMRYQKLWSMVKAIDSVYRGNIVTTKSFHNQMVNNEVNFPVTSELLKNSKDAVLYIMGDEDSRRAAVLSAPSIAALMKRVSDVSSVLLATWHAEAKADADLNEVILTAIAREDVEVLKRLFSEGSEVKQATMAAIFTSEFAKTSEVIRSFMAQNGSVTEFVAELLKGLAQKHVVINKDHRMLVKALDLISAPHTGEVPVTALTPVTSGSGIDARIQVLVNIIGDALRNNDDDLISKISSQNPDFYAAFGTASLKAEIAKANAFNQMEKDVAVRKLDNLTAGFWTVVREQITARNGEEAWTRFASKIDSVKLGYEIK